MSSVATEALLDARGVLVLAELAGDIMMDEEAVVFEETMEDDSEEYDGRGRPARPRVTCHHALRSQLGSRYQHSRI